MKTYPSPKEFSSSADWFATFTEALREAVRFYEKAHNEEPPTAFRLNGETFDLVVAEMRKGDPRFRADTVRLGAVSIYRGAPGPFRVTLLPDETVSSAA